MTQATTRREFLGWGVKAGLASLAIDPLIAACGGAAPSPAASASVSARVQGLRSAGTVTVGLYNSAPYAYLGSDGNLTGLNTDIATTVMKGLGIPKINGQLVEFSALIPGLLANRWDMLTGTYITPARCQQVAFGDPEMQLGEGFIVKKGNPKNLHSYADAVKDSSVMCGILAAGSEANLFKQAGLPDNRLVTFPDPATAIAGIAAGRADLLAVTQLTAVAQVQKDGGTRVAVATPFTQPNNPTTGKPNWGYLASGFRLNDTDLRDAYNAELKKIRDNGQLLKIYKKYGLGQAEIDGAKSQTTTQLCTPSS